MAGRDAAGGIRGFVAAALLAAAALAPAAHAGPRVDYKQVFSTPVPGASAGTDTQLLYKNPSDPNAKPIPVRREIFTFPEGTVFDGAAVPDCTAPDLELQLMGDAACPPESRVIVSDGDTSMAGFPGGGEQALTVNGYDGGPDGSDSARVIGTPTDLPIIHGVAHIRNNGRVVTVEIPVSPGGPPDGQSALRKIHNISPPRELGGHAYIRTPPTCPASGLWHFEAQFVFDDGVSEHDAYDMSCRRPAPRAHARSHRKKKHHKRARAQRR
ncbi:MAG: hypothetical protein ACJ76Z_16440 [Thermoleophilaceae bacterium]